MRGSFRLIVGTGVAALCACTVENNSSIAILYNGLAEGEECVVSGDTERYLSQGALDVTLGHGYWMVPIIENRMRETTESRTPTTGTEVQATSERNHIQIRGYEVELEVTCSGADADCAAVQSVVNRRFFSPGSADIPPAGTQPVGVNVIPGEVSRALRGQGLLRQGEYLVRARLRAVGGRNKDEEIKTGDFDYYITICETCLVRGVSPQRACPGGELEGYCGRGQDFALDCCFSGPDLYCPASSAPTN